MNDYQTVNILMIIFASISGLALLGIIWILSILLISSKNSRRAESAFSGNYRGEAMRRDSKTTNMVGTRVFGRLKYR